MQPCLNLALLSAAAVFALLPLSNAAEYFVSPNGSDKNPGTSEQPFSSLTRARDAIRELKRLRGLPEGGVTVWIGEGTYYLSEPVVFGPEDSGTANKPIVYASLPNQKPTISGGMKIDGQWEPFRDGILMCKVEGVNEGFGQLFVDGKRQVRARHPNSLDGTCVTPPKCLKVAGVGSFPHTFIKYEEPMKRWARPEEAIIHVMHSGGYTYLQWQIKNVDWDKQTINFGKGGWQFAAPAFTPNYKTSRHMALISDQSLYFVENVFEDLDAPGEWYFDRTRGALYFKPPQGIDPQKALIEASCLKQLIEFRGTKDNPVRHITFSALRFAHSDPVFLEQWEIPSHGDWSIYRGGAAYFDGAEDCAIKECFFDAVGGTAVFGNNHLRRIKISDNVFIESGDSAVVLAGKSHLNFNKTIQCQYCKKMYPWGWGKPKDEYNAECEISNNLIHDIGVFSKQCAGVCLSMGMKNTVGHNHIYNTPRAAININDGCWGGHVVEFNDLHHTQLETHDHGPFNSWGREPYWCFVQSHGPASHPAGDVKKYSPNTTVIRNNYFHWASPRSSGIDLDDGSSNYHIYNNVCVGEPIKLREGDYRTVENNIVINPVAHSFTTHVCYEGNHDRIARNIIVCNYTCGSPEIDLAFREGKPLLWGVLMPNQGRWAEELDYNIYFSGKGPFVADFTTRNGERKMYNWDEWRRLGYYDEHSIVADPMFMDPANGDFRVKPESPALKLGFKNFPMDQFGLRQPFGGAKWGQKSAAASPGGAK